MKIILISGKAGSGKDTFGMVMKQQLQKHGKEVLITHYADLLKFMCKQYFGWDGVKDEAGRGLLQYVGTNVVRYKMPDFWVNFIADILWLFPNEWDYVIIPDCRFPNEIERLKERDYDVIHVNIVRNNNVSGLTSDQMQHPSETALDEVEADYTIVNDGSIEDLRKWVLPITTE